MFSYSFADVIFVLIVKNLFVLLHKKSPCDTFGHNPRKCQGAVSLTCWELQVLGTCHSEALETGSALICTDVNTTQLFGH